MDRAAHKPRRPDQRQADVARREVQDSGQGALRHDNPRHDNVSFHAVDLLAGVQGEPVASVANAFDVAKAANKNVLNLVRIDKLRRLLQFRKHAFALPSRAPRARGERLPCDSAITSSLFLTEGGDEGYRAVNAADLSLSKLITLLLILVIAAWAAPDVLAMVGPK